MMKKILLISSIVFSQQALSSYTQQDLDYIANDSVKNETKIFLDLSFNKDKKENKLSTFFEKPEKKYFEFGSYLKTNGKLFVSIERENITKQVFNSFLNTYTPYEHCRININYKYKEIDKVSKENKFFYPTEVLKKSDNISIDCSKINSEIIIDKDISFNVKQISN